MSCLFQGEVITDMCIEKPALVETMSWHPDRKILTVGWTTGEITICNIHESETYVQSSYHQSPVNVLQWSTAGSHLVSAEKVIRICILSLFSSLLSPSLLPSLSLQSGLVLLWQVESKGQLYHTPLHQTKATGPVTHCVILSHDSK